MLARALSAAVPARPRANLFGALPDFPQPLEPPLRRTLADLDPKTYGGLGDLVPNPDSAPPRRRRRASRRQRRLRSTRRCRPSAMSPASTKTTRRCRRFARPRSPHSKRPPPPTMARTRRSAPAARSPTLPDTTNIDTPAAPAKTSIFSLFGRQHQRPAGYDDTTAVYDISAKLLFMPDGTTIEAHSGLGDSMDDITQVGAHAKGPTPPDLYDLQARELLFHGIAAIRLVPVGGDAAVYGREGLLAHPFMMGDNGDSNGCVSIKDYNAFLKAYQDGKIKRLAVIAKANS